MIRLIAFLCLTSISRADPDPPVLVTYLGIGFPNPPDIVSRTAVSIAQGYVTHLNLAFFAFNGTANNYSIALPNAANSAARGGPPVPVNNTYNCTFPGSNAPLYDLSVHHLPGMGSECITLTELVARLKKSSSTVKLLASVGGWNIANSKNYGPNMKNALYGPTRATTIANMKRFMHKYNLDGLDLDWEYPGRGALYSMEAVGSGGTCAAGTEAGQCDESYTLDPTASPGCNTTGGEYQTLGQMNEGQPCIGSPTLANQTQNNLTLFNSTIVAHGRPIPGGGHYDKQVGNAVGGFGKIMQDVCAAMHSESWLCTMTIDGATWANHWYINQLPAAIEACDYSSIMAYDYSGFWQGSAQTSLNAPLYQDAELCPKSVYKDPLTIAQNIFVTNNTQSVDYGIRPWQTYAYYHLGTAHSAAWLKNHSLSTVNGTSASPSSATGQRPLPFCPQVIYFDMLADPAPVGSNWLPCKTCSNATMLNSNAFPNGMSRTSKEGYWVNVAHIPLTIEQMWHNMLLQIKSNPKKYVLGLAFYARSFQYFKDPSAPTYTSTGLYEGFTNGSAMSYAELMKIEGQYTQTFLRTVSARGNASTNNPREVYLYDNDTFISFDNPETIAAKSKFAADQGMAGIMTFHLGGDYFVQGNDVGELQRAAVDNIWKSTTPAPTPAPTPSSAKSDAWMWIVLAIAIVAIAALAYWLRRPRRALLVDVQQPSVPKLYINGATVLVTTAKRTKEKYQSKILTWDGVVRSSQQSNLPQNIVWTSEPSAANKPGHLLAQIGSDPILQKVYIRAAIPEPTRTTSRPKQLATAPGTSDYSNDRLILTLKL